MVLEPEVTIGVFDGEDEYIFGDVSAVGVSAAGEIFVLDRQVPVVRVYSAAGTHLRNLGREGGGPGEFKRPRSLAFLPDGRLLVRDAGNGRINVYDQDGESVTSWRLPAGGTFNTSRPMYVDHVGNAYTLVLLKTGLSPWEWEYGLAKYTPAGEHHDTLLVPTWDFEPLSVTAQREGSSSSSSVPFSPQVHWTYSPLGYFVGGLSTAYRIDLFRADQAILRIERDFEPVPVLAGERAEREREITENFKRNYGSWRWNGPRIPDTKPPFTDLMVDADGRIWVRVSQRAHEFRSAEEAREEAARTGRPQGRYAERTAYEVFDRDGRFLGPVRVPDDFRASPDPVARGDTVWAVTRDDLDVARVVRFRMVPANERAGR